MGNPALLISIASLCVVGAVIGAIVYGSHSSSGTSDDINSGGSGGDKLVSSTKAVQSICQPTTYKDTCVNTLTKAAGNTTDPKELVKMAFNVAKEEVAKALEKSSTIKAVKNDPMASQALRICKEIIGYSVGDLERVVESATEYQLDNLDRFLEDLKVWIGGTITYQEVCLEAFKNTSGDAGQKMKKLLSTSRKLTSNALSIVGEVKDLVGSLGLAGFSLGSSGSGSGRRLLAAAKKELPPAGEYPTWLLDPKRKIMSLPASQLKPNAVVAKDGSGQFKTITEALASVPKKNDDLFIIYIKEGVYDEYIVVPRKMNNIMFIGDGPTKTRITGKKSFATGTQTFLTAPVAILGDGFMATDIGFENTAGPSGHQAVALRVDALWAVFYNCHFDGYQDTIYAVRGIHFFRDCMITGTIDFVFGDGKTVFQNSKLIIRKPNESQGCMVTAQGRGDPQEVSAIILQGCTIDGDPEYLAVKAKNKAYLGRPWRPYSKTIVMNSYIGDAISPEGWTAWAGTAGLDTLFYAEYGNQGPGANKTQRVKWAGIKNLSPAEVEAYTPKKYFIDDQWITATGVPYVPGMMSGPLL